MIRHKVTAFCFASLLIVDVAQAASSPWFGTWKLRLKDPGEQPETLIYSDAGGGAMRMVSVEAKSVIVTRFDGKPSPDIGAGAGPGPGRTLAIKAASPTSYSWTFSVGGKPIASGINTLAADGKTFNEVSWSATKPGKPITLVYERQ